MCRACPPRHARIRRGRAVVGRLGAERRVDRGGAPRWRRPKPHRRPRRRPLRRLHCLRHRPSPHRGPLPKPRSRKSELVQISDPYIELRTGPGRGYPIFFVSPRNDWIEIELRHTDWFRIRTEDNKVGWVSRQQLESTLTAAGSTKTFRDVLLDDYLTRKVQLGAAWGHFKSEPMLKLWTSYRLSDTLSLEGTIGQVQGVFSGTDLWHIDVLIEPWSDHRISPFFGVGVGKFKNFPNLSLIGATDTNAKLGSGPGRRPLLPHRALRHERRLLALHRLHQRPAIDRIPRLDGGALFLLLTSSS